MFVRTLCLIALTTAALVAHAVNLSTLPAAAQSKISSMFGAQVAQYSIHPGRSGFVAANQSVQYRFTSGGVAIQTNDAKEMLRLRSYGYGQHRTLASHVTPQANGNRVEYVRPKLTEWYVNGPVGMEQGFTLQTAPGKSQGDALTLEFALSGSLTAKADAGGRNVTLVSGKGAGVLDYAGLSATDAGGRDLPAHVEVQGQLLTLRIDDKNARYPLTVDPWIKAATLTPAGDPSGLYGLGFAVGIDADTIVAGMPFYSGPFINQGAAFVFVKTGANWSSMTQTALLTASDANFDAVLGWGAAISGNTIVLGAPYGGSGNPTLYVYEKPASGWTNMKETARLTSSDGLMRPYSVSVSGSTIAAGGGSSAYVFVKPAGGWSNTIETAKLTATVDAGFVSFGSDVAVDGNTVVVSGSKSGNLAQPLGADAVYVKPAGGWTSMTETAILSATDTRGTLAPVAISGNTIVAGDRGDSILGHVAPGKVHVFVRPASGWVNATQTAILTASDAATYDGLGSSVSITGNTIVAGAPSKIVNNHLQAGALYAYTKPSGGWKDMTETSELTVPGGGGGNLGVAVAIRGNTIVASRPGTNGNIGSALVYKQQ